MWWRRCSLSRPRLCMMPAESSERESQKPRQDKVSEWLRYGKSNLHNGNLYACTFSYSVSLCVSSVRLWPLPVWRWSQERNLARVWKNPGLLHAAKWSKIKSYSLGWRNVSCTYHLLKWFIFSKGTWDIYVCACWERLQFTVENDQQGCGRHCASSPVFFRTSWSIRRNKGRKRSKCWMVRWKPSWWMTQKQSGSCLSLYAVE